MKRIPFLTTISLGVLGVVGVSLVAQEQGRSSQTHNPGYSVTTTSKKPGAFGAMGNPNTAESSISKRPGWQQLKDPWAPGEQMETEAIALFKKGRLQEAEQKCRRALSLLRGTPIAESPRALLGDIQVAKGQYKEALQSYGVARRHSANPQMSLNIALCYVRLGDFKMAQMFYSDRALLKYSSIRKDDLPGTDNLRSLEASILMALGAEADVTADPQNALPHYKRAAMLSPRNWLLGELTGKCLDELKQYDEAVPYYKRAVQYGGDKVSREVKRRAQGLK